MKKNSRFALALLAASGAVAFSTGARADDAPSGSPAPAAAANNTGSEEVVVTGSRVVRNGNASPTPLTVVPTEQILQVVPGTLSEALNTLPQFGGSQTSTAGPGSGVRNGAAAFLTLRNVGDNHTLVLYDGHRLAPAEGQASHASDVDLNLIPQLLLKRTDIVTGGAGATYGSDAIAGVVNLITDTNFNGLKLNASTGVSSRSDDRTNDIALAAGTRVLNDHGHIEFSYEHRADDGILDWRDKLDRPFFGAIYGGGGSGTAASPWIVTTDARLSNASFGGLITSATGALSSLQNLNFSQDNVGSPFVRATDGAFYRNSSIKASLDYNRYFGRFDYDFSNDLHAYVQYGNTHEVTDNFFQNPQLTFNVGLNNPFLDGVTINSPTMTTAQFQLLRTNNPNGQFRMTQWLVNQEANAGPIQTTVDYQMLLGGIDGTLGDYRWSIHAGHQDNEMSIINFSNVDVGRFLAAVDSVRVGSSIVCRAALTNPTYAGCVPYDPFGPTAGQAAWNYITHPSVGMTHMQLDEIQADISGSPLHTWAGPIDMDLSAEWHDTNYSLHSSTTTFDTIDCTGMRFATLTGAAVTGNCNGPGTANPTAEWSGNVLNNLPHAEISVFETALEAQVPLLRNAPFAKSFEVNGAVRYTNYSTTGEAWEWKVGAVWQPVDDLRFRATRSHDIRAPNLFELFAPQQVAVQNFQDFTAGPSYGTHQSGTVPLITTGEPNLKNEEADTTTVGAVWQPHFVPHLSTSVDIWQVKMANTIFQIRGIDTFVQQACIDSNGTSPYCSFFVRPTPTSFPTALLAVNANIASQETYGVDWETNYSTEVFGGHKLDLRSFVVWQPHDVFNTGTGTILDISGAYNDLPANVAPAPQVRATLIASYNFTPAFKVSLMERWRSRLKCESSTEGTATQHVCDPATTNAVGYTNLTAAYDFSLAGASVEVFGNVENLFDKFPDPAAQATQSRPDRGITPMAIGDDPVGRYFIAGVRVRM
jgi:outer membrane receptor protein involved in Fe transport